MLGSRRPGVGAAGSERRWTIDNPFARLTETDLRARTSVKWTLFPPDVLPLFVAEMDAVLAEPVAAALRRAVTLSDTGYAHGSRYAEALAGFAERRWGWTFDPGTTRLVADVMIGVAEVLRTLTAPGDTVVITPPVYPPFFSFVGHAGRRVRPVPLGPDGRLDLSALEAVFAAGRSRAGTAMLLCSPHNPTGTVHTAEELGRLAALAQEHGVRLVVDEIHAPLTDPDATFTPFLAVPGSERAVVVTSAAKGWNLAGLKAAVAVPGPEAADDLAQLPPEVSHGASQFGVIAHVAAWTEGDQWLDDHLAGLEANRRLLGDLLADQLPEVVWRPGQATYLAWLDCTGLGLGDSPCEAFLDRGRVALNPGVAFGPGGEGYARLNYATSPAILTAAVGRMAATVGR